MNSLNKQFQTSHFQLGNSSVFVAFHPLLGGLIAEVQGGGVPVHGDISISQRGSVIGAVDHAASAEPETVTHTQPVE